MIGWKVKFLIKKRKGKMGKKITVLECILVLCIGLAIGGFLTYNYYNSDDGSILHIRMRGNGNPGKKTGAKKEEEGAAKPPPTPAPSAPAIPAPVPVQTPKPKPRQKPGTFTSPGGGGGGGGGGGRAKPVPTAPPMPPVYEEGYNYSHENNFVSNAELTRIRWLSVPENARYLNTLSEIVAILTPRARRNSHHQAIKNNFLNILADESSNKQNRFMDALDYILTSLKITITPEQIVLGINMLENMPAAKFEDSLTPYLAGNHKVVNTIEAIARAAAAISFSFNTGTVDQIMVCICEQKDTFTEVLDYGDLLVSLSYACCIHFRKNFPLLVALLLTTDYPRGSVEELMNVSDIIVNMSSYKPGSSCVDSTPLADIVSLETKVMCDLLTTLSLAAAHVHLSNALDIKQKGGEHVNHVLSIASEMDMFHRKQEAIVRVLKAIFARQRPGEPLTAATALFMSVVIATGDTTMGFLSMLAPLTTTVDYAVDPSHCVTMPIVDGLNLFHGWETLDA